MLRMEFVSHLRIWVLAQDLILLTCTRAEQSQGPGETVKGPGLPSSPWTCFRTCSGPRQQMMLRDPCSHTADTGGPTIGQFHLNSSGHITCVLFSWELCPVPPPPLAKKYQNRPNLVCLWALQSQETGDVAVTPCWKLPTRPVLKRRIRWSRPAGYTQPFLTTDRLALSPLCGSPTADVFASVTSLDEEPHWIKCN